MKARTEKTTTAALAPLKQLDGLRTNRPRTYDRLMVALAEIVAAVKDDEVQSVGRSAADPRVVRIMAALDRAAASPDRSALTLVAGTIITLGDTTFPLEGWNPDGARAIVLAYALNAPERGVDAMAEVADAKLEWCEWWDREGWAQSGAEGALVARAKTSRGHALRQTVANKTLRRSKRRAK